MRRRVRGPWLQIGGCAVALGFIAAMGALGSRGVAGGRAAAPAGAAGSLAQSASTGASATPTSDPREVALVAAAKAYVNAYNRAFVTGSAAELRSLTVDGTEAAGAAGDAAVVVRTNHATFVATAIGYSKITVALLTDTARVEVTSVVTGHPASWPELTASGPDRTLNANSQILDLELQGGQWLIADIH